MTHIPNKTMFLGLKEQSISRNTEKAIEKAIVGFGASVFFAGNIVFWVSALDFTNGYTGGQNSYLTQSDASSQDTYKLGMLGGVGLGFSGLLIMGLGATLFQ